MALSISQFPSQKIPMSEKTEEWGIKCIEAALTITTNDTSKIRKTKATKKINYDLANGIIDETDIEKAFNPMGIRGVKFPAKIQNYPIELSKFSVLKGEETKRRYDWRVRVTNEDAVSGKSEQLRNQIYNLIISEISNPNYTEEQATRRFRQLKHYQDYEFNDMHEKMATSILSYFWYTQKMRTIFSDAFWDVLVAAEEIYGVDIFHNDLIISKRNILNVSTFGSGESYKIEDSDIIVEDGFKSVGSIIDDFWDELSPEEVDTIEEGGRFSRNAASIVFAGPEDIQSQSKVIDYSSSQLIPIGGKSQLWGYGGAFDEDGNVRVSRVVWRSRRKIGDFKFYDKQGSEQHTIIDENFPLWQFESYGWTAEWHWINEFWQGYKIGMDIYKKIQPLPRIGTSMTNPSKCIPPYVGTVYNIGSNEGMSLMDRAKPYKYLYNVYMRRTELASARNKGVLAELDLGIIPDGWDEELVMMYAEANGYYVTDSLKESHKGVSQGKLVSTLRQRGLDVINLDSSNAIKANLELARYVKYELGEICGITPQREGQVDNRETFGGVERSVTQSSHITEEWFRLHDSTKIRVQELVLESAKWCWRDFTGDSALKLQYVDDGLISYMFMVDGLIFASTEYGLYVSNSSNDAELVAAIKSLAQAALQNDKATITDLISIYRDTSVSSMSRKLEGAERERNEREDGFRQQEIDVQKQNQQVLERIEQMKMDQEMRIEIGKLEAKVTIEQMKLEAQAMKNDGQGDKGSKDTEKMQNNIEKLRLQLDFKYKELQEKTSLAMTKMKQDKELTEKKISATKTKSVAKK